MPHASSHPALPRALVLASTRPLAELTATVLSGLGYAARGVADALDLAQAFAEAPAWSLVVLDLSLGWAPVADLGRSIRSRWPQAELLLLGDAAAPGLARLALHLGARDLLPASLEGLAELPALLRRPAAAEAVAAPSGRVAELEEELERLRASAALDGGELTRRVAELGHDLHEPLRSLRELGRRLGDRLGRQGDGEGELLAARLDAAAARLQGLVDSALDEVRRPASPATAAAESADSHRVLREVIESLASVVEETGGVVTHGPLPELGLPGHQLRRILQNLVGNALRHGGTPPEVHVTAERGDPGWVLSVRDNGPGIPLAERTRIFERGARGPGARGEGMGLGLSIVQRLVERAGGRVWIEDAVPQGTLFRVALPGDRVLEDDITMQRAPATRLEDTRPIPLTRQAKPS